LRGNNYKITAPEGYATSYINFNTVQANDYRPDIQVDQRIFFRALGTTYKVLSKSVNGSAAIVEHTVEPKSIGSPMHKHTHEDEISYVLEGELSTIQDGKVQTASPGQYIVKPRGIFHTFWNAGNDRVRFIEIITPGNFEYYFAELAQFLQPGKPPQVDKIRETGAKYGLVVDPTAVEGIINKYGLNPLG
jgi:uncharacterized cupin superfamily protein